MRYADISSPTEAQVPDMPSIPAGLQPGGYRPQEEIVREREWPKDSREADLKLLDRDEFDPMLVSVLPVCLFISANFWKGSPKSEAGELYGSRAEVAAVMTAIPQRWRRYRPTKKCV